jgi:hypothetical protein
MRLERYFGQSVSGKQRVNAHGQRTGRKHIYQIEIILYEITLEVLQG